MRFRLGRGRSPDPGREGTVYRAKPGFRLRGDSSLESPAPAVAPLMATRTADPWGQGDSRYPHHPAPPDPQQPWAAEQRAGGPGPATDPRVARTRRRRRPRRVLAWLLVAVVLYPLLLGVLAWFSLGRFDAIPDGERPASGAGRTYLVIGSDSREDLSREERARLGTGQATGIRTDTIMLLQTQLGGPATLVSIPRDSYVSIPGHGKNKINAAYALGGPKLLVTTVEQATGLKVDDVVMTGLGGFAGVVDAVGGVRLCPKTAIKDDKAHLDVAAGCQTMDGKTALGYARARYSDPRGDLGRVERQREVLAAIASKTLSPSVIGVPWRAVPAAVAGGKALTVDSGSTPWSVARFVLGMRAVSGGGGVTLTVPIGGDVSTPAGAALTWDSEQANRLFEAMARGDRDTVRSIAEDQKQKG